MALSKPECDAILRARAEVHVLVNQETGNYVTRLVFMPEEFPVHPPVYIARLCEMSGPGKPSFKACKANKYPGVICSSKRFRQLIPTDATGSLVETPCGILDWYEIPDMGAGDPEYDEGKEFTPIVPGQVYRVPSNCLMNALKVIREGGLVWVSTGTYIDLGYGTEGKSPCKIEDGWIPLNSLRQIEIDSGPQPTYRMAAKDGENEREVSFKHNEKALFQILRCKFEMNEAVDAMASKLSVHPLVRQMSDIKECWSCDESESDETVCDSDESFELVCTCGVDGKDPNCDYVKCSVPCSPVGPTSSKYRIRSTPVSKSLLSEGHGEDGPAEKKVKTEAPEETEPFVFSNGLKKSKAEALREKIRAFRRAQAGKKLTGFRSSYV